MHAKVLYNDRIVPADRAILHPGQLGLLAGWGVFTTMKIERGIPFAYERHWARMNKDAALIHVPLPADAETVYRRLLQLIAANRVSNATMRVCVVRSQGGVFEGPGSGNPSDLIAFTIDSKGHGETIALTVKRNGRHAASPFAGTKTLSWAHNLTMVEEAQQAGYGEVILLNEREEAAECTSANLFAVLDGVTYTPPLSSGPLPGVTRAVMLEELKLDEAPVRERVLRLDDLYAAAEVFITSSTRELLAVDRIFDRRLIAAEAGAWPVMERLRAALREYTAAYVEERLAR
jgi:branched-chain amino acid aminotransferase